MQIKRRDMLKGAGITAAGAAGSLVVSIQAASGATTYGSNGPVILRSGVPVARALSPRVAANLAANMNSVNRPASTYRVFNGRGIYRVSQSRVVATATSSTTANLLVSVLNKIITDPIPPGSPILATPITSTPGQVQLNWTAPTSDGGSPITGYNVYIDGVRQ